MRAATGDITRCAAFWSQAAASQFAASAAGNTPPVTKPKYRPPVQATVPGEPTSSSSARTLAGSDDSCGNGPPSFSNPAISSAVGAVRFSAILWTYRIARCAAVASKPAWFQAEGEIRSVVVGLIYVQS